MGIGAEFMLDTINANNTAKVQTPPSAPSTPIVNYPSITTDMQIKISWPQLSTVDLQGGINVYSYEVFWTDSNLFEWELLYTDVPTYNGQLLYAKTDPLDTSVLT